MMALMTLTAVHDPIALPGAVAKFERDYRFYKGRFGRSFPEELKVPVFLIRLPKFREAGMKWRSASGMNDNDALKESIMSYS